MAIIVRKLRDYPNGDLLLGWDPIPGAAGYQITHSLTTKKPHTWDAYVQRDNNFPACNTRVQGGAEWYRVREIELDEEGEYRPGDPDPGPGPGLLFPEAAVSNPIELTIPEATTDFWLPEANRDYVINLERKPRRGLVIYGPGTTGLVKNVQINDSRWRCTVPRGSGSAYRHGGLRLQIRAEHISIRDYFKESFGVVGDTSADGIGLACAPWTKVTFQRFLIEMPKDSLEPTEHIDNLQIQGPIGHLELGLGTMYLAGTRPPNHYGKGLQLDELAWGGSSGGPFPVDIRKLDFESLGGVPFQDANGNTQFSRSGMHMVQGTRRIAISFDEVYAAADDGENQLDFPNYIWIHSIGTIPTVTGTRPNRVAEFRDPVTNIKGLFRERAKGQHFVSRAMLGY
jgi:hypothetical protein